MSYVPLQRTFQPLAEETSVADIPFRHRLFSSDIGWTDLLRLKRTIISGAAGAGKTAEMQQRARELVQQGKAAFFVSMRAVSKSGFVACLNDNEATKFSRWQTSCDEGYFFIDSKDEAVQAGERMDDALRRLGQELGAKLDRAHIFVSTRPSDLTVKQDVEVFRHFCPLVSAYSSSETPEQVLLSVLESEQTSHSTRLEQLADRGDFQVVRLTPLSDADARLYASLKTEHLMPNADAFFEKLAGSGLRSLAAYPRDLSIFAKYWLKHGTISTYRTMLNEYCEESLEELRPHCNTAHVTPIATARQMTERLAALCVLGRVGGMLALDEPDVPNSGVKADSCLAKDVWPERTRNDHLSVQSRALFDSVVIGQLRLRRDLVEHLAARWIRRVYSGHGQGWRIHREVLVSVGSRTIALNSRASLAILLSIDDEALFDRLLLHAPLRFVVDTAVHAFSEDQRIRILDACAGFLSTGADLRGMEWGADADILRAFVFPNALGRLQSLWTQHSDSCDNVRAFLLWILREAQGHDCAEVALDAATRFEWGERTNLLGVQALAVCNSASAKATFVGRLMKDSRRKRFTLKVTQQAIEYLFPEFIEHDDFVKLAVRWETDSGNGTYALHSYAAAWAERVQPDFDRAALLQACVKRVTLNAKCDHPEYEFPAPNNKLLFTFASSLVKRWLSELRMEESGDVLIESCAQLLCLDASHTSANDIHVAIVQLLNTRLTDKQQIYWRQIAVTRSRRAAVGKTSDGPFDVWAQKQFSWSSEDTTELYEALAKSPVADDRKIALQHLYQLDTERGANLDGVQRLWAALQEHQELLATLDKWLEPREIDKALSEHQEQRAEYAAREKTKADEERKALIQLHARLQLQRDAFADTDLRALRNWLELRSQKIAHSSGAYSLASQLPALSYAFGPNVAKTFEAGVRQYWRKSIVVPAEIEGRGISPSRGSRTALLGLELEFGGDAAISKSMLSEQEVERGLEWAMSEGSLPNWLDNLERCFAEILRAKLIGPLLARLSDQNEHYQPIRDLQYRLPRLRELLAPDIFQWLLSNRRKPDAILSAILDVCVSATSVDRLKLAALLDARAREVADAQQMYLTHLMRVDAGRGAICLTSRECSSMNIAEFFAASFDNRARKVDLDFLPSASLDEKRRIYCELVQSSLAAIDPKSDVDHADEGLYTHSSRGKAQEARNHLLAKLGAIPGGATIAALQGIHAQPNAEPLREWIARMIEQRITEDAEPTPLTPAQIIEIETCCEMTPATGKQLLQLVMDRLADIQHELLHGAFSNIELLRLASSEAHFQIWLTSELNKLANGRFTAVREPEVAEKKKPDIQVTTAHPSGKQVAIEMKLVDKSWTVSRLEKGLSHQLVGQYLKHESCCHGIYVLVRQRKKRWKTGGIEMTFERLLERLASQAAQLTQRMSTNGEVVVLQPFGTEARR